MVGFGQSQGRAERLVKLTSALDLGTPRTLGELVDRFGIYAGKNQRAIDKQFERDRADLAEAGVHVERIQWGDKHAYWIRRRTEPVTLADEELDVLAVLSATVGDPATGASVATLAGAAGQFPADAAAGKVAVDQFDVPPPVVTALTAGRQLQASYRDAKGNVSTRTFEPWRVVHRRGLTYVVSWDVDRQAERNFRLDRFEGGFDDVGEATRSRPASSVGPVYPLELYDIAVLAPEAARLDAAEMGGTVRAGDDGWLEVSFPGFRSEPILAWTLRHGGILTSPDDLREEFERRLQRLCDRHTSAPASVARPKVPKAKAQTLSPERVRRLLVLPSYLGELAGMTRSELAAALGCTVEELQVELDLLDSLELDGHGYVGEVNETDSGELVYVRHVHDPKVELVPADALRLLVMLDVLRPLLGEELPGLASLRAKLQAVVPAEVDVEVAGEHHRDLPLLRTAIERRDVVRFDYRGRKDEHWRVRQVAPDQFRVANGAVYLAGTDVVSGEERQFRLDRMGPVEVVGQVPLVAAEPVMPAYVATEAEVEVLLVLDHAATWLLTHLQPVAVERRDDGSAVVLVRTDAVPWLLGHVLAAGGTAEVIEPPRVRDDVARLAGDALAVSRGTPPHG